MPIKPIKENDFEYLFPVILFLFLSLFIKYFVKYNISNITL